MQITVKHSKFGTFTTDDGTSKQSVTQASEWIFNKISNCRFKKRAFKAFKIYRGSIAIEGNHGNFLEARIGREVWELIKANK